MRLSPLIIDIEGEVLSESEQSLLAHPLIGGVILFARNFSSSNQLRDLVQQIKNCRHGELLVCVDHEGGRVQRFQQDFTPIPAMSQFGQRYQDDPAFACQQAEQCGWLMASELIAHGVDLSFAPVLDLNWGCSSVIGDRSFSAHAEAVTALARAFINGMNSAGMAAVGKHFPGHGGVAADTHTAVAIDERDEETLLHQDMAPFAALIAEKKLAGIMPAHVIYSAVANQPAGFSGKWLQKILREELSFEGLVFSDDLNMKAAKVMGDPCQRVHAALQAGCDVVLYCNDPAGVVELLEGISFEQISQWQAESAAFYPGQAEPNLHQLLVQPRVSFEALKQQQAWQDAVAMVQSLT